MISTQSPASLAVSRAIAEAELRRTEMMHGMGEPRAVALLIDQAEDAARSPLAHDQLLALALRAASRSGEPDHAVLDALRAAPGALARQDIARAVFAQYDEARFRAVLKAAPDRELQRGARRVGREPLSLARWLRSAAALARGLWDHPALPVDPPTRGAMLAAAEALEQRARALAVAARRPPLPRSIEEMRA
ncbi:MAG: hypothetical protein IT546_01295 [Caulobacteraceae bacterium]|nr:hypothetical protein [Caulobacteraceae bacterium]